MDIGNDNLKVIYLARWYPNRYDPMPGLFIQRHAEAANICSDIGVVYTHQIESDSTDNEVYSIDYELIAGVPTAKTYYLASNSRILLINKLVNALRFFRANFKGIKIIKKQLGGVNILHIHVLTRLGLIALYYRIFHGKPYLISEHWSRYLDLTGSFNGFFRKKITKLVVKYASCVTTVTDNLAKAMQSHGLDNNNYFVLPNVVDNVFLNNPHSHQKENGKSVIVHVSCFEDKSKNVSGILRVISKLSHSRNDFVFRLVGDGMDMDLLRNYSVKLGLTNNQVVFTGLLEGATLVKEMAEADLMVIFSNYENFPVVINESLSLGVPVIATRVGGIPERINEENGALIDAGNEDQLIEKITKFLDGRLSFNMDKIQKSAKGEFSPASIGEILCGLYTKAYK